MPLYKYFCSTCDQVFEIFHHVGEKWEICLYCSSKAVERFYQTDSWTPPSRKAKPGDVVKQYIEDAKEDLGEMKQDSKGKVY